MISVTFTCPMCGDVWTEEQDPKDEWFKLGLRQTLCEACAQKVLTRIRERMKNEVLSSGSCSNRQ